MIGTTIIDELRESGVELSIVGHRIRIRAARGALTPEVRSKVQDNVAAIRAVLALTAIPSSIRRRHELGWTDARYEALCIRVLGKVGIRSAKDDARVLAAMPRPNEDPSR